jgi:hypothetical protein
MAPPSTSDRFPPQGVNETSDDFVNITVGAPDEEQRSFRASKAILSFYSGYFDAALNGRFREAADGVSLTTEDPPTFEIFLHWINTRRFYESTLDPVILLGYDTMAKLWVFGDAQDVPLLQNETIDTFHQKLKCTHNRPDIDTIDYIWSNTPPNAKLRVLIVDLFSLVLEKPHMDAMRRQMERTTGKFSQASEEWYQDETDIDEYMDEYLNARRNPRPGQWAPYESDPCRWHVHEAGVTCAEAAAAPESTFCLQKYLNGEETAVDEMDLQASGVQAW